MVSQGKSAKRKWVNDMPALCFIPKISIGFFPLDETIELVTGASPGRDSTPKGGGGGALRTPKLSYGTMCFVSARGTGEFVLGIRQGEIFLFDPMCLYPKY